MRKLLNGSETMQDSTAHNKPRSGLIAALDIGTTKVVCLIGRPVTRIDGKTTIKVEGIGHQVSRGLKAGTIVDLDQAEASIRATVEAAEQMAGENINEVTVNLSCGAPKSRLLAYDVAVSGREVSEGDLRRVLDPQALSNAYPEDHSPVHVIPVGYSVDDNKGIHDPRGMHGETLGVNMHLITAASNARKNLETCVARCHLGLENVVVSPYAAALATLVRDEMDLGVTLIDMGGGTTSIAVFFDGEVMHTDVIPVGGTNVTNDIARGLSTSIVHAERMKTLYGSAIPSPSDDREMIKVPLVGEDESDEGNHITRSMLVGIIRPRLEETFELVHDRLEAAGFGQATGQRVVLVGGACQMPGVRELATEILNKQVRIGRPKTVEGLAEAVSGSAFATVAGLLSFAAENPAEAPGKAYRPLGETSRRWGRFGQWLRENF